MVESPCSFCDESEIKKKNKEIIFSSKNFRVFPSLGPVVEAHLLIASKEHYSSMAQVPNVNYSELESVQDKIRKLLIDHYCEPIFFEHGPLSGKERAGRCIEHAHLHAVPVRVSLLEEVVEHFPAKIITAFSQLPTDVAYLFLEENNIRYVTEIREVLPSQYLRQVLAVKLGVPEKWDWRANKGIKEIENALKKLKQSN